MHEYVKHPNYPLPEPIAHRGYSAKHPENTMAAVEAAIVVGFNSVELDVQVTSDGVMVLLHDEDLYRVTGSRALVEQTEWAEISRLRVDGTDPIPRFEEVMSSWPDLRVVIDLKSDSVVPPLLRFLGSSSCWHRVCTGTYGGKGMAALKAEFGDKLCTALPMREMMRLRFASYGLPTWRFSDDCIQAPPQRHRMTILDRRFVKAAHARDLPIQAWTINARDKMNHLLDIGVDAIMTDEAEILKAVMIERGIWRD